MTALLCLYYPQQLLPGLTAIKSFRQWKGADPTAPVIALVWAPASLAGRARLRRLESFQVLMEPFSCVTLVFPDESEIRSHLSQNHRVSTKARYLRKKFSNETFDTIYFAHDVSADFIAQSAMQAFPDAKRICFGDALGIFQSNAYFTRMTYPNFGLSEVVTLPRQTLRSALFRLKRYWSLPFDRHYLDAQYVAPILPCDPGQDFLRGKINIPVDERVVHETSDQLSLAAERALADKRFAISTLPDQAVLLLLGAYSESRLTTEEREIGLYVEVVKRHVKLGRPVFLKPHPASRHDKTDRISAALAQDFAVNVIEGDEFPVEVMPQLIRRAIVISFSYSSVSLPFLHKVKVVHALDEAVIDGYFPEHSRKWMKESNELYLTQIKLVNKPL